METIRDLFDLSHTRARAYLAGFTYPWEALAGISDLIRQLGPALGEEFEQRARRGQPRRGQKPPWKPSCQSPAASLSGTG